MAVIPASCARVKPYALGRLLITPHISASSFSALMLSIMACKLLPLPEIKTQSLVDGVLTRLSQLAVHRLWLECHQLTRRFHRVLSMLQ